MKINYKKSLKFITLLLASLLIATVSATIYNSLFLSASVGVEGLSLQWDDTSIDSGLVANIQGAYCSLSGLRAPQGGNRTYSKAIGLKTNASTTFAIEVVDVTGDGTSDLNYIFTEIYDEGNNLKGNLTIWQGGAKGTTPVTDISMDADDVWRLQWTIAWKASADTSDDVTVSLKVTTPSP